MVRQPRSRSVDWLWWATSSGELRPFLDHPDYEQQEIAREKSAVSVQLARLGDPLMDCLDVLAPDVFADAVWRLPNPTRTDTLRALRVPPARRPTPTIARHALNRLRKQTPSVRGYTAQVATLPVLRVLLPTTLDTDSDELDGEILESLKTTTFPPDLVRLAALADWGFSCQAAALLRLALTEADLALPAWPADVIADIAAACRRFEDFCRDRMCGVTDPPSPLRTFDEALGYARAAADAVAAAVAAGRAPEDADLAILARVAPAAAEARAAVAALVEAEADTLPEDRPGLAEAITAHEAAVHARELADVARVGTLAGPAALATALAELHDLAADLADRHETWDAADRRRVLALVDLAALIDAIAADRDDGVDELAEGMRPHLPDPMVVNAALRGRLAWAGEDGPEIPAAPDTGPGEPDADSPSGEEPAQEDGDGDGAEAGAGEPAVEAGAVAAEGGSGTEVSEPGAAETRAGTPQVPEPRAAEPRVSESDVPDSGSTGVQADAAADEDVDAVVDTVVLGALIGRGEFAAAQARMAAEPERAAALRALAYAAAARSDTGALAASLRDELDAMAGRESSHDRVTQLLTVAAAARAAVLCGHSTYGLLQDAAAGLGDLPAVAALARHIAAGSAQGLLGGTRNLGALEALAEAEAGAQAGADAAAEALRHPRNLRFPRATSIAQLWWRPEDGLLGRLLRQAADNDRRDLEEVAEALRRLTKHHELENRLAAVDEEFRHGKGHRLEGPARRRLLEYARESVETVGHWVDATRKVAETEAEAESWIAGPLTDLRHALLADRSAAEAELAEVAAHAGDPLTAGAAKAAADSLAATLDLLDGHALTGPESTPEAVLGQTPPARAGATGTTAAASGGSVEETGPTALLPPG